MGNPFTLQQHFITGFDSTSMPDRNTDLFQATNHNERYQYDLALVKKLCIERIRYSIGGHYVYATPGGKPDWSRIDGPLATLQALGLRPIVDLVHHTSAPVSILGQDFLASPNLGPWLEEYALEVIERYQVQEITLFNEPYLTSQLCGEHGVWYPYCKGTASFLAMLVNVTMAVVRASRAIRRYHPQVQHILTDTCEVHAPDPANQAETVEWAAFLNQRRFLGDDLMSGKVHEDHPLFAYLLNNGVKTENLSWLEEHGLPPDVRGLDYYRQSEWIWQKEWQGHWSESRSGFAEVTKQYIAHLGTDQRLMLSETNYFGSPEERLRWHQAVWQSYCDLLADGAKLEGYCWYPFLDTVDFQHMLLHANGDVDPVGIYSLDEQGWQRQPNAFTHALAAALGGEIGFEANP